MQHDGRGYDTEHHGKNERTVRVAGARQLLAGQACDGCGDDTARPDPAHQQALAPIHARAQGRQTDGGGPHEEHDGQGRQHDRPGDMAHHGGIYVGGEKNEEAETRKTVRLSLKRRSSCSPVTSMLASTTPNIVAPTRPVSAWIASPVA